MPHIWHVLLIRWPRSSVIWINFDGFESFFAFHSSPIFVLGSEGFDELEPLQADGRDWAGSWNGLEDGFCVASDVKSKCCGSTLDGLVES